MVLSERDGSIGKDEVTKLEETSPTVRIVWQLGNNEATQNIWEI
jgi:hypothetical protein